MTITYSNGTHPTAKTFNPTEAVRDAMKLQRNSAPAGAIAPFDIIFRNGRVDKTFDTYEAANAYLLAHPNKTMRYHLAQ